MKDSREAVGIFAADSISELRDTVDEVTDPGLCEYASFPNGGIAWHGRARAVPVTDVDFEIEDRPLVNVIGDVQVSEQWVRGLMDEAGFRPL